MTPQTGQTLFSVDDTPVKPAYVWRNPRPNVDWDKQDPLPDGVKISPGDALQQGVYFYVVKLDGSLHAAHEDDMYDSLARRYSGHSSLSDRENVFMAGTFEVDHNGLITEFDNTSGHYKSGSFSPGYEADPSQYMSLEDIVRRSFADFGLSDSGVWKPFKWTR